MVCGPTPAVEGLKVLPLTAVPLQVPPVGLSEPSASSTEVSLIQASRLSPASTEGRAYTVTVLVLVLEQELPSV